MRSYDLNASVHKGEPYSASFEQSRFALPSLKVGNILEALENNR